MATTTQERTDWSPLVVPLLVGAAVAVAVGVYGQAHDPTLRQPYTLFFTGTINLKVWFATLSVVFALIQIGSSLRLYGRVGDPDTVPSWLGDAHRLSGTLAFAFTLPVAYHCLWALGFQSDQGSRVLIHSLVGCLFYGAFVTKVLFVRRSGLPGWTLPAAGGVAFTALVIIWLTSSVWFWTEIDFPGF